MEGKFNSTPLISPEITKLLRDFEFAGFEGKDLELLRQLLTNETMHGILILTTPGQAPVIIDTSDTATRLELGNRISLVVGDMHEEMTQLETDMNLNPSLEFHPHVPGSSSIH